MNILISLTLILLTSLVFAAQPPEILESLKDDLLAKRKHLEEIRSAQETNMNDWVKMATQEIQDYQRQIDNVDLNLAALDIKLQQAKSINWTNFSNIAVNNEPL